MSTGSTGALLHAVDIDVQIEAADGKQPIWADKEEEAGNWIFDSVHALVRDVFSGRVQVDRDRIEANNYKRTLAVFASPSAEHASILQGDMSGLAARLANDLAAKFGADHKTPKITFTPLRAFLTEAGSGSGGPGFGQAQQSPYGATQMWNNDPQQPQQPQQQPPNQAPAGGMVPYVPQIFPQFAAPPPPNETTIAKNGLGPTGTMLLSLMLGSFAIATAMLGFLYADTRAALGEVNEEIQAVRDDRDRYVQANQRFAAAYDFNTQTDREIIALEEEIQSIARDKGYDEIELTERPKWENVIPPMLARHKEYLEERKQYAIGLRPRSTGAPRQLPDQSGYLIGE